jgi:hypothetical protein
MGVAHSLCSSDLSVALPYHVPVINIKPCGPKPGTDGPHPLLKSAEDEGRHLKCIIEVSEQLLSALQNDGRPSKVDPIKVQCTGVC